MSKSRSKPKVVSSRGSENSDEVLGAVSKVKARPVLISDDSSSCGEETDPSNPFSRPKPKVVSSRRSENSYEILGAVNKVEALPILISDDSSSGEEADTSNLLSSMKTRFTQFVTKTKGKDKKKVSPRDTPIKIKPNSYLFRQNTVVDSVVGGKYLNNPYSVDTIADAEATIPSSSRSTTNYHTNDASVGVINRKPIQPQPFELNETRLLESLNSSSRGHTTFCSYARTESRPLGSTEPSTSTLAMSEHGPQPATSRVVAAITPLYLNEIKQRLTDKEKIKAINHIANIVFKNLSYIRGKEPLSPLTKDFVKWPAEYHIDFHSKFGYGGFSIVVKAYDHKHGNRPVAIKFANDKPGASDSIYNEYTTMKGIEHKGIRHCIRALNYAPKMIVIPYYHWDLYEAVLHYSDKGGINIKTCLNIIVQVTQCILDLKNKLNRIHNDLKLENIMVTEDLSEPCVIDLGMMSSVSENNFYHGTYTYSYGYRAKNTDQLYNVSVGMILFDILSDGDIVPGLTVGTMKWPDLKDLDSLIKGGNDLKEIIRRTLHTDQSRNRYTMEQLDCALNASLKRY